MINRNFLKAVVVALPVFSLIGCRTMDRAYMATRERVQDFEVRAYMQDKLRVDQDTNGNAGYLMGKPKSEDRSALKDTRKIYVLEVSEKPDKETQQMLDEIDKYEPLTTSKINIKERTTPPPRRVVKTSVVNDRVDIPDLDSIEVSEKSKPQQSSATMKDVYTESGVSYVDYVVEKGDTLQKISKKFYDGYSKWPKIFEANKDKIKSPEAIKPGMSLRIPVQQ